MRVTWRQKVAPLIDEVIGRIGKGNRKMLRLALRSACPFTKEESYPHRVWRDEIRRQLKLKRPLFQRRVRSCKGQGTLEFF